MSLVWKYVVVIVDQCFHSLNTQLKSWDKKFEDRVKIEVDERMEKFER